MSDPIAEAAAHLSDAAPSSTEPQRSAPGSGEAGNALLGTSPTDIAATISMVTVDAGRESQANSSDISIGTEPSPMGAEIETRTLETKTYADGSSATGYGLPDVSPAQAEAEPEPIPRESHLMMLELKIAGFRAKLANAERVALDEFEAIVAHVKAVL